MDDSNHLSELEEELTRLRLENKKLKREVKHISKDNELLRVANEQAAHTQAFIQRDNLRQVFYNRQLLMTSPYLLILTDENLRVMMISDAFYKYSNDEAVKFRIGTEISEIMNKIMDEFSLKDFIEKCREAFESEQTVNYIMRCTIKGSLVDFQISICPMKQDEKVIGLNIVCVDMTEVIDAKERAEAAARAKSSFLANMSHEIRTPINSVLGMDEMILRESTEERIINFALNIKNAGRTLMSLINEILDFSKVEEGKMEIIPTQYETAVLINDLVNMINPRAQKKGLSFNKAIDKELPSILYGDEIRIKQCILNLLENAVKYTESGSIDLGINYRRKDRDNIFLEVYVSDTGIGMKKEDIDRIFSPFTRVDEERNRTIEGTGLGMTITRDLLEMMGSKLSVESSYGSGSVFSFVLKQGVVSWDPLGDYEEHIKSIARKETKYTASFTAPDVRALVVDDTPMNLLVTRELLRHTQIRLDEADSGKKCLELLNNNSYDLILLDYRMPEMDGIETLKRIRELEGNPNQNIPVIALTANAISGAREEFMKEGFSDYITKPVEGERLEKVILQYIPEDKVSKTEIERSSGINNCGSEETYKKVFGIFIDDIDKKTEVIRTAIENGDIKRYTVEVHSLKSSARIVGAMQLSKLAAELEQAGNENDIPKILKETERMLRMYADMRPAESEKETADTQPKEPLTPEMWTDALSTLAEFAQLMDYENAVLVLNNLANYSIPDENAASFDDLKKMVEALQWDEVTRRIGELIK